MPGLQDGERGLRDSWRRKRLVELFILRIWHSLYKIGGGSAAVAICHGIIALLEKAMVLEQRDGDHSCTPTGLLYPERVE
jgi:hypothetical protein